MSGKGRPQRKALSEGGSRFVRITHVRCPACEQEGLLNNEGRSRVVGGQQLRGASKYVGLTKASRGCEICDGSGSIETTDRERLLAAGYDPQYAWMDPYALKK